MNTKMLAKNWTNCLSASSLDVQPLWVVLVCMLTANPFFKTEDNLDKKLSNSRWKHIFLFVHVLATLPRHQEYWLQ